MYPPGAVTTQQMLIREGRRARAILPGQIRQPPPQSPNTCHQDRSLLGPPGQQLAIRAEGPHPIESAPPRRGRNRRCAALSGLRRDAPERERRRTTPCRSKNDQAHICSPKPIGAWCSARGTSPRVLSRPFVGTTVSHSSLGCAPAAMPNGIGRTSCMISWGTF